MDKQNATIPEPGCDRTGWMMFAHSGPLQLCTLIPEQIHLGDIVHALSRMNRFNGQTRAPISVLWHSMMVAELCRYEAPATRLEALLHDGAEAYVGDWISPLKGLTDGTLEKLRDRIQRTVFEAAGLHRNTNALSEPVQKADLLMARYEGNQEYGYGRRIPWHEPLRGVEIERVNAAMVLCGPPSEVPTEQQHVQWFFLKEVGKLLAQTAPNAPLNRTVAEAGNVYRNTAGASSPR